MDVPLVPVAEITEDGEDLHCDECDRIFAENENAVYWGDTFCCETCSETLLRTVQKEAEELAREHCKITETLPKYDQMQEYRCTPEEYEAGVRESYTRNSHLCFCRHNCTNYDELIKGLDKHSHYLRDQIFYEAIHSRMNELLMEQIDEDGDEDFDEDEVDNAL